jgi:hypothetical protein
MIINDHMEKVNKFFDLKALLSPDGLTILKEYMYNNNIDFTKLDKLSESDYNILDKCLSIILDMNPEESNILINDIHRW